MKMKKQKLSAHCRQTAAMTSAPILWNCGFPGPWKLQWGLGGPWINRRVCPASPRPPPHFLVTVDTAASVIRGPFCVALVYKTKQKGMAWGGGRKYYRETEKKRIREALLSSTFPHAFCLLCSLGWLLCTWATYRACLSVYRGIPCVCDL